MTTLALLLYQSCISLMITAFHIVVFAWQSALLPDLCQNPKSLQQKY